MKELRHPITRALYGIDPETGLVRIQDRGRVGIYTAKGEWRSGDVLEVDPEMCVWVGGPQPAAQYTKTFKTV